MSKPRVTHFIRFRDLVSQSSSNSNAPDALDDCRVTNVRAMKELLDYVAFDEDEDEGAELDPGTVDTTNLPPIE